MAVEITDLHRHQKDVVRELFINTADDNYITARWCFAEALNVDFFWLALHAIEKYAKAVLLLNGQSAKGYGHGISKLYEQLKLIAPDLLPTTLRKPDNLDGVHWREESPETYLASLSKQGNADNRYQIYGYVRQSEELFKLDQMVFAIRRLCRVLDGYHLGKATPDTPNHTNREVLASQPGFWLVTHGFLEETAGGNRGEGLRRVLLNCNMPFAPADYDHREFPTRMSGRNPVLWLILERMKKGDPSEPRSPLAAELCDWVLENIQLPDGVKRQLREALKKRPP